MKRTTSKLTLIFLATCVILTLGLTRTSYSQIKTPDSKISGDLLQLTAKKTASTLKSKSALTPPPFVPANDIIVTGNGLVLIQVLAKNKGENILDELEQIGFKKSGIYKRTVTGFLPINSIASLNGIKDLIFASPSYRPITNSGIAVTNGDTALRSYAVRTDLGIYGNGSKIGVISDSYNSLQTADSGVISGDLPGALNPYGYTTDVEVLSDITDGSDEGRAMMEIIHDVAPGAELAFYTAYNGQADFAQGILKLADAGCNIIVDDVSYFGEPFFQDGIIAQAVDEAVKKHKVAYYSSAGNAANQSYESKFRTTGDTLLLVNPYLGQVYGDYIMHDFDPGPGVDYFQKISFPPGYSLKYALQWDEPFASADENSPGSSSDLDVFFALEEDPQAIYMESASNNIHGDPFEYLGIVNNGTDTLYAYIAIGKWIGAEGDNPNPQLIKAINFGESLFDEYDTQSPTCMGHSNAKYAHSIGATYWWRTPEYAPVYGYDTAILNSYSSLGGIPILMKPNGKPYRHPKIRRNPDFVAPDGGNTTFFGQLLNDGDNFPNFFGTSASAPHAAAVHALLNEIANGKVRNNFIDYCMTSTALDMDNPYTPGFDTYYDFASGYGFLQADRAAEMLMKFTFEPLSVYATCSEDPNSTRNWVIVNPNNFKVTVNWSVFGSNQEGSITALPGKNQVTTNSVPFYNLMLISNSIGNLTYYNAAYSSWQPCSWFKSAVDNNELADAGELQVITKVYPNPFVSDIHINVYTENSGKITAVISGLNGATVLEQEYKVGEGLHVLDINTSNLQQGTYILKVQNNNGEILETTPIIKK
jgi:hypothetical protein